MPRALQRYEGNTIAEQIGVVRLQDDATAATRALIQGTEVAARGFERIAASAEAEYIAHLELDTREKAAEIAAKHRLDPAAFKSEWNGHTNGVLNGVTPVFRNRAALALKGAGERHFEAITARAAAAETAKAQEAWAEKGDVLRADYLGLVRAGKGNSAEAMQAANLYSLHTQEGVRLGVYNADTAAIHRDRLAAEADAEEIQQQAVLAYRRGGRAAAQKILDRLDTDPAIAPLLKRKVVTAESIRAGAETRIREIEAEAAAARRAALEGADYQLWRVTNGYEADPEKLKQYAAALGPADKSRGASIVKTLLAKAGEVSAFRDQPLSEMAASIDTTRAALEDPKAPPELRAELETKVAIYQRAQRDFEADPWAGGLRFGPGRKHSFDRTRIDAPDFADRIAERRTAADAVSAFQGRAIAPLYADEAAGIMAAIVTAPSAADRAIIMGKVNDALGPYARTFWASVSRGEGAARRMDFERNASIGAVAREDRGLATDILLGRQARADNPKYAPSSEKAEGELRGLIGPAFRYMPDRREIMVQETIDLAALAAQRAGDTSQSTSYLRDAFKRRFGDLVTSGGYWSGVKTLPPRADVSQGQFDTFVSTSTNEDFGLGTGPGGKPMLPILPRTGMAVTEEVWRRNGKLFAVGEGRYRVEIGDEVLVDPRTGRPAVLDFWTWQRRQDAMHR